MWKVTLESDGQNVFIRDSEQGVTISVESFIDLMKKSLPIYREVANNKGDFGGLQIIYPSGRIDDIYYISIDAYLDIIGDEKKNLTDEDLDALDALTAFAGKKEHLERAYQISKRQGRDGICRIIDSVLNEEVEKC